MFVFFILSAWKLVQVFPIMYALFNALVVTNLVYFLSKYTVVCILIVHPVSIIIGFDLCREHTHTALEAQRVMTWNWLREREPETVVYQVRGVWGQGRFETFSWETVWQVWRKRNRAQRQPINTSAFKLWTRF